MGRIGGGELLLILFVAMLVFGPSKLADMGKGLGEGLKNFKKSLQPEEDAKAPVPMAAPPAPPAPVAEVKVVAAPEPSDPGKVNPPPTAS